MITARFEDDNAFAAVSEDVWQWDYGQTLRIEGLTIDEGSEVDFSTTAVYGEAITVTGEAVDGGLEVKIPDTVLAVKKTENYNIYAFTFLKGVNEGETTHRITIPVKARPKRSDSIDVSPGGTGTGGSGGTYILPVATADTLGGIKIGSGLEVTTDGTTSVDFSEFVNAGARMEYDEETQTMLYFGFMYDEETSTLCY